MFLTRIFCLSLAENEILAIPPTSKQTGKTLLVVLEAAPQYKRYLWIRNVTGMK